MASSLGIVTFKMKKCLGKGVFMIINKNGSPLQPLWDVVPSTTRMDHGCKVPHVLLTKASGCFNVPILEPRQCAWPVLFFLNRNQQICCVSYRQSDEVSRLVQTVEPFLLDDSTEQLIGDLQRKLRKKHHHHQLQKCDIT